MPQVEPSDLFRGTTVIVAPHMDDCALACGGSLARLDSCASVHVVYATDGTRSPSPEIPWIDAADPNLGSIRESEARSAMGFLGVPKDQLHFLGLPDGRLRHHRDTLRARLMDLLSVVGARTVLAPFRYDRHPDHLVVNRVVTQTVLQDLEAVAMYEFFVYYRWKLLRGGDVRKYVRESELVQIDVSSVADTKARAIGHFASQTTRFYDWQSRPNLTPQLVAAVSHEPEMFLRFDPALQGAEVLTRSVPWIRVVHRVEPFLKKRKDRLVAWGRRATLRPDGARA